MQKLFLRTLTIGLALVFCAYPSGAIQTRPIEVAASASPAEDSQLFELGQASKIRSVTRSPSNIKVVSYNIRWRSGEDLRKLAQLLKTDPEIGGASIIGLQEVDRHKERTANQNTAKFLADELGMYYVWAAPPAAKSEKEEETGVVLLSFYPLTDVYRLVLPHEGPGLRRRVAVGATILIGQTSFRVYSVHTDSRIPIDQKLDQMKVALDDLAHYNKEMPAIVMGDLNTWEREAVAKTFKLFPIAGFHTPIDDQPTFSQKVLFVSVDLKLDWIWLRHLVDASWGVNRKIKLSDHWPVWIVVRTKPSTHKV